MQYLLNFRRQSLGLKLCLTFVSLTLGLISPGAAQGGSFQFTGSMTCPRRGHTATLLRNGKVLVTGGWDGTNSLSSAELFDPASGTWSLTSAMGFPRAWHTATLLPSGRVLITGGWDAGNAPATEEVYDPVTGLWTAIAPMAGKRSSHTATLLASGEVLVAGGTDGTNTLSTAELYDPVSGTWSAAASMTSPRSVHTATLLPNGQVLLVGGWDAELSAEIYDPIAGTWTATADLSAPRYDHTATLLPNGLVLIAGGMAFGVFGEFSIRDAELYDPATGTWADTAPMGQARFGHIATLLPSGLVLVSGGFELLPFFAEWTLTTSELYDPGLASWRDAETMRASRAYHSATLASGEVLIAGGRSYDFQTDTRLSSAEIYRPDADTNSVPAAPTLINGRTLANGSFEFQFLSLPGTSFTVLATPHASLPLSDWIVLGGVTEFAPGLYEFTDVNAPSFQQRYYRVRYP